MSASVTIIPAPGMPDVGEPTSSFCRCDGNILTAPRYVGYSKDLDGLAPRNAERALIQIVKELDKKNNGAFNDSWCVEADRKWSDLREMKEGTQGIQFPLGPWKTPEEFWGDQTRSRIRASAIRFILYYRSGCKVVFPESYVTDEASWDVYKGTVDTI